MGPSHLEEVIGRARTKQLQTWIKYNQFQGKRWSIQRCLVILGAPPFAVYRSSRYTGKKTPIKTDRGKRWSIYEEYRGSELRGWADELFKESMIKWHPDKYPKGLKDFYTKKCQSIGEAYERAKKILKWHGG
jgi:hypothetical protein